MVRLALLFAALLRLCLPAQAVTVPTIGPIPNQIVYIGGSQLIVPFQLNAPPGTGAYNVSVGYSSRRTPYPLQVIGAGTNRYLAMQAIPATRGEVVPGNATVFVNASAGGITNQTSFILTVLPTEFVYESVTSFVPVSQPAWGDFNGDGQLDLIGNQGISSSSMVQILINQNAGRLFASQRTVLGRLLAVPPADFDGDGDLDMLAQGKEPAPMLLVNQAGGIPPFRLPTFTNIPLSLSLTNLVGGAWADFDGDGDLDLVVTRTDSKGLVPQPVRLLRNEGGGRLALLEAELPASSGPVVVADFDGDGSEDLLLTNTGQKADTVLLLHNDSEGDFTDTGTRFPSGLVAAAGWSDFNGDGIPDVWLQFKTVVGKTVTTNELVLLQQQEDGSFQETSRIGSDVMRQAGAPVWGDFDQDGTPDFIAPFNQPAYQLRPGPLGTFPMPSTNSFLTIWHNDGAGHFHPKGLVSTNLSNAVLAAGDADGDGALDLVLPSLQGSQIVLNLNRPANLPPATPDGLVAFAEGRNVFFFWNESADPNQAAPLTYNLRVGTRPGANDVVASMSLSSGAREIMAPGNCEFSSFRALRLPLALPADALYWSVQAVDNSFVGSPFAPEQTLALDLPGNRPPVIAGLSNVVVAPDGGRFLRFTVTDDRTRAEDITLQAQASNPLLFPAGSLNLNPAIDNIVKPPQHLLSLQPTAQATGESDISIIATDRKGLSSTAVFHVTVILTPKGNSLPSLLLSAPTGDGSLRVSVQDSPLAGMALEQSEDLIHWSPVTGVQFDSNSLPGLSLPHPTDKDRQFYRLRPVR